MKNIFKENDVLYRKSKEVNVFKSKVDSFYNIDSLIKDYESYRDHILKFKEGVSAEWITWQQTAGDLSKNVLSIYDEQIHESFKKIKDLLKEACLFYEININKTKYYISSEYIDSVRTDAWYDFGGIRIPCFSGIMSIGEDSFILKINDQDILIEPGEIAVFEAGHKIRYNIENVKIISFSIAPLSMIKGHYPQKWMPV